MLLGWLGLAGLGLAVVWLLVLSAWLYQTNAHYKRITEGVDKSNLKSILDKLFSQQNQTEGSLKRLEEGLIALENKAKFHIQKVGLVRFNPYAETGGDQSFALALLDANDFGFVFLSLHSRGGTRFYIKPIKEGKSGYELSKEEKKAIEEAKKK